MTTSGRKFFSATSIKSVWEDIISELCSQLKNARGNLGILYVSEDLLPNLENILNRLKKLIHGLMMKIYEKLFAH